MPVDNGVFETAETATMTLVPLPTYHVGGAPASIGITDDEPIVTLAVTDPGASEKAAGQVVDPGQFTLNRTGSTAAPLTVGISLTGTATRGADYVLTVNDAVISGMTITIPAGQASVTVDVDVIDDLLVDPAETVILALTPTTAYLRAGASPGTVNLADDDE
jgi:hypothetical protein